MSKVTLDSLPTSVTAAETLRRNQTLWPAATSDSAAKDAPKAKDSNIGRSQPTRK